MEDDKYKELKETWAIFKCEIWTVQPFKSILKLAEKILDWLQSALIDYINCAGLPAGATVLAYHRKGDQHMNKPLSEWTLGEVQKYCKNTQCGDCCIGLWCENMNKGPSDWDLSEPPRWTEQDKEDARALKRLIANASYVWRSSEGSNPKLYDKYEDFVSVLRLDCFAALPPRTKVTLDEIIGGGE